MVGARALTGDILLCSLNVYVEEYNARIKGFFEMEKSIMLMNR